jgi:hypothetical protein
MAEELTYTPKPAKSGRGKKPRDLISGVNVLRTESKAEFAKVLAGFRQDVEPRNFIENIYVNDMASETWEVMFYRRVKTGILNNALRRALAPIVRQILGRPGNLFRFGQVFIAAEELAYDWLFTEEAKRRVSALLEEAGFDESAIEAAAYRLVANDLEKADRMLSAAFDRRDQAFRRIAKYRKSFAQQLRVSSDRILAADEVPGIASGAGA